MLFHTLDFAIFLLALVPLFLLAPHRARWVVLLAASLVFFGMLGVPALLLALAAVTLASYLAGRAIDTSLRGRAVWLWAAVAFNVLVLAAFKFLPGSWFGPGTGAGLLATVGISYFTFQGISYVSDVYTGVQKPERHLGYFALYMAFFPKILQGPIERAGDLLPQLKRRFEFDYDLVRTGAILFAWGLFKKTVVADRAAPVVDAVYGSVTSYQGPPLALGTYLYGIQLYCDFSGYTDMALGAAILFGIRLTQNFDNPYGARSIAEFWRRWHISFSRWIFTYVFNPLQIALRDLRTTGLVLGLILTFLISGIWHGVGWTYVVWGLLHGTYMAVSICTRSIRKRWHDRVWRGRPGLGYAWQVFATVHLVMLSWVFFRAQNLSDAWYVLTHVATGVSGTRALLFEVGTFNLLVAGLGTAVVCWVDLQGQSRLIENILQRRVWFRWTAYYALAAAIVLFGADARAVFIYFQF